MTSVAAFNFTYSLQGKGKNKTELVIEKKLTPKFTYFIHKVVTPKEYLQCSKAKRSRTSLVFE